MREDIDFSVAFYYMMNFKRHLIIHLLDARYLSLLQADLLPHMENNIRGLAGHTLDKLEDLIK